jgi:ADP-ribose pyrophosphatase YjhB (NUDIX family)
MSSKSSTEAPELAEFQGAHLAVDVALFTVAPRADGSLALAVLCQKRQDGLAAGEWALVGRMLRDRERLSEAVQKALKIKCGIEGINPRQLFVLDEPTRDSRGWVVSVAHTSTQRWSLLQPYVENDNNLALTYISGQKPKYRFPEGQKSLPFENDLILDRAVEDIRMRYEDSPDPDFLLPDQFTVLELREIHEAVLDRQLDKDLFRRKMIDKLKPTGLTSNGAMGKPAQLFKRVESSKS